VSEKTLAYGSIAEQQAALDRLRDTEIVLERERVAAERKLADVQDAIIRLEREISRQKRYSLTYMLEGDIEPPRYLGKRRF
jgi:hypothetical protein